MLLHALRSGARLQAALVLGFLEWTKGEKSSNRAARFAFPPSTVASLDAELV